MKDLNESRFAVLKFDFRFPVVSAKKNFKFSFFWMHSLALASNFDL